MKICRVVEGCMFYFLMHFTKWFMVGDVCTCLKATVKELIEKDRVKLEERENKE